MVTVTALLAVILALFFIILLVVFQRRIKLKTEEMYRAIIETQEKERERIGRDLHDDTGTMLNALRLELEDVDKEGKAHVHELINKIVVGIRNAAHYLCPPLLQSEGLRGALIKLCESIDHAGKTEVIFTSRDEHDQQIENTSALHIYRIVSELINNALKHGKASEILVCYRCTENNLEIKVIDNGCGMPSDLSENQGIGWKSIQTRLKVLGGSYTLDSGKDIGTFVSLNFPLSKL